MTNEEKAEIIKEINHDINSGIYEGFNKLKKRLEYLAHKLSKTIYIKNADDLSKNEVRDLIENGYLRE